MDSTSCDSSDNSDVSLLAQGIVQRKGGTFTCLVYDKKRGQLVRFTCHKGHKGSLTPFDDLESVWCKRCNAHAAMRSTIEMAHELAAKHNGKFLSATYEGALEKYDWQCQEGHYFNVSYNSIHGGSWCPTCSAGKRESICRAILEFLYAKPFPTVRPDWLASPHTDNNLEIDGFCEELQIGFEHNGRHHYMFLPHFHKTEASYKLMQERDTTKQDLCNKANVKLLIIPYAVKHDALYTFIRDMCPDTHALTPETLDLDSLQVAGRGHRKLGEIRKYLADKHPGAKLVSTTYVNNTTPLNLVCANGHQFSKTWLRCINHEWLCRSCFEEARRQDVLRKIAEYCACFNIVMQSEYINNVQKLQWRCNDCDNVSEVTWNYMKRKTEKACCG